MGVPGAQGLDGVPQAGALAPTQRLGGLLVAGDHSLGVADRGAVREPGISRQFRPDAGLVAVEQEADRPGAEAVQGKVGPGHRHRRAVIASHGVNRKNYWVRHGAGWNSLGPDPISGRKNQQGRRNSGHPPGPDLSAHVR